MKIIKKITQRRAKSLPEYSFIKEKFTEIKKKRGAKSEGIERSISIDKLNFFIVLEYVNIAEKIDYNKIFPNDNYKLDVEGLLEEQDKIIQHINKRKSNYPEIFYKLGVINEVVGCFLIATRKTNIENISVKNTKNTISVKIKDLFPKEIKQICEDYSFTRAEILNKEEEQFERFSRLSFDEKDMILQSIIENASTNSIAFYYPQDEIEEGSNEDNEMEEANNLPVKGVLKLEEVFNQNIDKITSIEFLKSLLKKAVEKENYEFCAKIRDRMEFLAIK